MAEGKKSFILYADLIHTVKQMPSDKAGELFLTILEYVNDENPEIKDLMVKLVFEPIKQQFKRDLEKYNDKKKKWSEAGKKSAKARSEKKNPTESTDVENVKIKSTDPTVNVNVNDTVNVNVNDNVNVNVNDNVNVIKEKVIRAKRFLPPTLLEIQSYCSERKNKVDSEKFLDFYESKGWLIGKNKMKCWKASVRTWEKNENKNNSGIKNHIKKDQDEW